MTVLDAFKMMPPAQRVTLVHPVEGVVTGCVLALCAMLDNSIKIQRVDMLQTQAEESNTIIVEVAED